MGEGPGRNCKEMAGAFQRFEWGVGLLVLFALFLAFPMHCLAYFGTNEDYLLSDTKPEDRITGHYLEFVSEETYTVQPGDTLWGIAESYLGNGADYREIAGRNSAAIKDADLLLPGTTLQLQKKLYTGAGLLDYIDSAVFRYGPCNRSDAFDGEAFLPPYQIFSFSPYYNDLKEADPYTNWERFQEEVIACGDKVCGERVSDLSFERYLVTGAGVLCYYCFTFDADNKDYLVMACLCYNSTTKSEAFALCDKALCSEEQMKEAKGKTFYAAVRYLDPGGGWIEKRCDYTGAEDWNYPQLRNPFTCAMRNLYTGPLPQEEEYSGDHAVIWKEPALAVLVREELAALWQLTPEEKQAFMERDVTAADLSRIEELELTYLPEDGRLYLQLNGSEENGILGSTITEKSSGKPELLSSLDDLANFAELKELTLEIKNCDITDLSAIGELTSLRMLDCRIYSKEKRVDSMEFLGSLENLRALFLRGADRLANWTYFWDDVTDLSVLRNCPRLAYLFVWAGNVESYDFLEDLPEIYYINLDMPSKDGKGVKPDEALLPNACFIEFYGERIRYEVGDGYERPIP